MTTKIILTMPQPGETITQGTVVHWLVHPGDLIKEGHPIVELETEKALFEYESPYEGKLTEIVGKEGETIPVGNPIAVFEVANEKASTYFMLGLGQKEAKDLKKANSSLKYAKLSPFVRRMMKEYAIELDELKNIEGTAPSGRITKENILHYLKQREHKASPDQSLNIVPLSPVRLRIAENMVKSKQTIPHAHTNLSVDLTPIIDFKNGIKADFEAKHGFPLSLMSLIFPSLRKAIEKNPLVNASFVDRDHQKAILFHQKIHLGLAVGTDQGLFIPVLHHVEALDPLTFAKNYHALIQRAQKAQLTLEDLTGMTFTFNNFGFFGTSIGVQIVLPPQSATLGMGRIEKRPWVVNDKIVTRSIAEFTLAFDHRVMDGRDAGGFMNQLKDLLENFKPPELG